MTGSLDAIRRVVAAFERSDWTEIDVRVGDVRVHLASTAPSHPAAPAAVAPAPDTTVPDAVRSPAPAPATPAAGPATADAGVGAAVPAGAHVVIAPSPGICWRSPEPGAPHFADVGDDVDAGATVCIVEVMKLMNHVKAGIAGRVVAVYGQNGAGVQKGEPLFAIVPSGSAS